MCKLARCLPSELITVFFDAHPSKLITAVYWYWMHIPENMSNAATMNCVNLDRAEESLTIDGEEHPSATLGGGIGNKDVAFGTNSFPPNLQRRSPRPLPPGHATTLQRPHPRRFHPRQRRSSKQVNKLQKEVIAPKKEAKEPCEEEVKEMKSIQADIKRLRDSDSTDPFTSLLVFGVICSTGKPKVPQRRPLHTTRRETTLDQEMIRQALQLSSRSIQPLAHRRVAVAVAAFFRNATPTRIQSEPLSTTHSFTSPIPIHSTRQFSSNPTATDSDKTQNDSSLIDHYESLVKSGEVTNDPHQVRALRELDRLRSECLPYLTEVSSDTTISTASSTPSSNGDEEWTITSLFSSTPSWANPSTTSLTKTIKKALSSNPPKGVYLHGGVGCGKTYCMNLFYDALPSDASKQKVHFHKFMLNVHKQMHKAKMINKLQGDAILENVLQTILEEGKVICFDEFQVTDIADALILKRLFTGLLEDGAVIVATSNRPPRDLYKGGLQRDLFLPFIDLLEETSVVVSMWESDMDYRLVGVSSESHNRGPHRVYFVDGKDDDGRGKSSKDEFEELFNTLTKGSLINSVILDVQGRQVFVPKASEEYGIARFSFYDLCGKAKGAADYLAIGERFHTVFIEDVPKLRYHEVNLVRRWITLIDALYECHVKMVVHAATTPDEMFTVDLENEHCDEVFAFDRTRSRMEEMRSEAYLKKKWVGSRPR
eukprot:scaffold906_cov186-Alexandrium_tamarense.AAC.47